VDSIAHGAHLSSGKLAKVNEYLDDNNLTDCAS